MDIVKIEDILKREHEKPYRLKQIKRAIFVDLVDNWGEITTLPKELRQKLAKVCSFFDLRPEKILNSKDNQAIKSLFILQDNLKIESVLMKHIDGRRTVCVSSQAGCPLACKFCATGKQGFKRNLITSEIIDQVLFFARLLKKEKEKITNIVFMGMGEPFLNYNNVLNSIKILNDKEGFNLGARHFSISTAGIVDGIKKLSNEKLQINLAISLHAPNNKLRTELMPINKNYPIEKVILAVKDYIKKTNRRVMFEYLMLDGINDEEIHAKELAIILKKYLDDLPYFVNLISYNPTSYLKFKHSPSKKIKKFKDILESLGIAVTQRYRFGEEINAACGQLSGNNK